MEMNTFKFFTLLYGYNSVSEVTTLWRYTNAFIIIVIFLDPR